MIDLGPLGSIRLHHWFRSDDKRAKHDHPSDFITLVLKGSYMDLGYVPDPNCDCEGDPSCIYCNTLEVMGPGMIRRRRAEHRHTVSVNPGGCWTLLYFWPERREWASGWLEKTPASCASASTISISTNTAIIPATNRDVLYYPPCTRYRLSTNTSSNLLMFRR